MSEQRSRLIRRAVRIAVQGDQSVLAALETFGATRKQVRRAGRLTIKKLLRVADKIKAKETARLAPR